MLFLFSFLFSFSTPGTEKGFFQIWEIFPKKICRSHFFSYNQEKEKEIFFKDI